MKKYEKYESLKYQPQHGVTNLIFLMGRILFQMFKIILIKFLPFVAMKLFNSTGKKITKDKNDDNKPFLEITEVVLVPCNFVDNKYQQISRFLHIDVPKKLFGQLLEISPVYFVFLKAINSEF